MDSDILSYALYDKSPAHSYAWEAIEKSLLGEIELCLTHTTISETYNVLFWFYRIRPLRNLLEKLTVTVGSLKIVEPSTMGLNVSLEDNIPLGDGFLIATALKHSEYKRGLLTEIISQSGSTREEFLKLLIEK